jgi:DNA-binding CsgD family transcriptional regulator
MSLFELDRPDEAERQLAAVANQQEDETGRVSYDVARGRLAAARGEVEEAWQHLARAAETARTVPFLANPSVLPWRSEAALAAHAAGRSSADLLAQEELRLARSYGAPRPIGVALRACGLLAGGEEGLELLTEAVEVLGTSPARLEEVRARVDLGGALRRAGRRVEAREVLREAHEAARELGAARLAAQAANELTLAGARRRGTAARGPDALTPAQRRVCELAAQGRSNPQIAAELFLSRRTVEFHLRGAFRKLGISSREELAGRLNP